jgi:hypothetical protein
MDISGGKARHLWAVRRRKGIALSQERSDENHSGDILNIYVVDHRIEVPASLSLLSVFLPTFAELTWRREHFFFVSACWSLIVS